MVKKKALEEKLIGLEAWDASPPVSFRPYL